MALLLAILFSCFINCEFLASAVRFCEGFLGHFLPRIYIYVSNYLMLNLYIEEKDINERLKLSRLGSRNFENKEFEPLSLMIYLLKS